MKLIALVLSAVLLTTAVLSAGCVTKNYSAPDYTAYFAKYWGNASNFGLSSDTVITVKPLSRTADRAYAGEYKVTTKYGNTETSKIQIEPLTSKGEATARYEQIISEKVNSGYTIITRDQNSSVTGVSTYVDKTSTDEGYNISYRYDTGINEWVVLVIYIKT